MAEKIEIRTYSDGGSRGNPGAAAIGWLIIQQNEVVSLGGSFLGIATNNLAEYTALLAVISAVKKSFPAKTSKIDLTCHLDSELVVKQLNGQYKIKDSNLRELATKIKNIYNHFNSVTIVHIPREKNSAADKLVNLILDNQENAKN